jgi:integrase
MAKSFIKFTAGWVVSPEARGVPGKTTEHRDAGVHGLSLRIYPSGRRVWCAVGGIRGTANTTRTVIGDVDKVGLDSARKQCREIIESWTLGKRFETPAARERREERDKIEARRAVARETERNKPLLFENVLDSYADKHLLGTKSGAQIRGLLDREFGRMWTGRRITDLKRSDVIAAINAILDRGHSASAKCALGALKAMVKWVHSREEFGLIDAPACTDRVTYAGLVPKSRRPKPRERVLTDAELRIIWSAASSSELAAPTGDLVKLLLLSGLRLRECAFIGRSEIGADGWLTVPPARMKQGKAHSVFITPAMRAIIDRQPVIGEFVFRRNDGPVRTFASLKVQCDNACTKTNGGALLPHWTFHDLRRTARSRWSCLASTDVCELALAHALPGGTIRNTYDKHRYQDELKSLFERWERVLLDIIEPDYNKVVSLPRRRGV